MEVGGAEVGVVWSTWEKGEGGEGRGEKGSGGGERRGGGGRGGER